MGDNRAARLYWRVCINIRVPSSFSTYFPAAGWFCTLKLRAHTLQVFLFYLLPGNKQQQQQQPLAIL